MRTRIRQVSAVLFFLFFFLLSPQEGSAQVMFIGTKTVAVKGGIPYRSDPFFGMGSFRIAAEYAQYLKGGDSWFLGVDVEENNIPKNDFYIPELTAVCTGGYNFFLLGDFARRFNLYGSVGGSLGYAMMNGNKAELIDGEVLAKTQSFVYGGKMGLHTDISLTSQLTITFGSGATILGNTLSKTVMRPYIEGGVKVSIF